MDSLDLIEQLQQQGDKGDSIVKALLEKNLIVDLDFSQNEELIEKINSLINSALSDRGNFSETELTDFIPHEKNTKNY